MQAQEVQRLEILIPLVAMELTPSLAQSPQLAVAVVAQEIQGRIRLDKMEGLVVVLVAAILALLLQGMATLHRLPLVKVIMVGQIILVHKPLVAVAGLVRQEIRTDKVMVVTERPLQSLAYQLLMLEEGAAGTI